MSRWIPLFALIGLLCFVLEGWMLWPFHVAGIPGMLEPSLAGWLVGAHDISTLAMLIGCATVAAAAVAMIRRRVHGTPAAPLGGWIALGLLLVVEGATLPTLGHALMARALRNPAAAGGTRGCGIVAAGATSTTPLVRARYHGVRYEALCPIGSDWDRFPLPEPEM